MVFTYQLFSKIILCASWENNIYYFNNITVCPPKRVSLQYYYTICIIVIILLYYSWPSYPIFVATRASSPSFTGPAKFYNFIYYFHVFDSRVHPFWRNSEKISALPRGFYFHRFIYIYIITLLWNSIVVIASAAAPRLHFGIILI